MPAQVPRHMPKEKKRLGHSEKQQQRPEETEPARKRRRAACPPEGKRSATQYGVKVDDVVLATDGTEIRIVTGQMSGSATGCQDFGYARLAEVEQGVGYDDFERCIALGQGCSCHRQHYWDRCDHEACAILQFLAVGSKLRDACRRCGTDPAALLKGTWHWRDALKHVRGASSEKPALQLRRTLFAHRASSGTRPRDTEQPAGPPVLLEAPNGASNGGQVYAVPGLPGVCIRAPLVQELPEPARVAASACPTASPQLYDKIAQLSPSQLKSLMQKIVRWGKTVECTTEHMDAILACCFVALVSGPGQYRHDLKVNMKGPRLALQRAVTAMIEDGIGEGDFGEELLYYACLAAVTQEESLRPSAPVVLAAANMLLRAAHSDSVLTWRQQGGTEPHRIAVSIRNVFTLLGAMPGDLRMFGAIGAGTRLRTLPPPESHRPAVRMTLLKLFSAHLDQHSEANFAHSVRNLEWRATTGANYREGRPLDPTKLLQMEEPQLVALAHTSPGLLPRPELPQTGSTLIPLHCELEDLAAYCAGEVTVPVGRKTFLAVFAPHDMQSVSIMEKPSRTQEDISYISLESTQYKEALAILRCKRVRLARPLDGYALVFVEDEWKVLAVSSAAAPEVLTGHVRVPLHAAAPRGHMGLLAIGQGLRSEGLPLLVARFRHLNDSDMREVLRTLSVVNAANDVHMAPLERAVDVVGARHQVYTFLAQVAFQAPGAMRLTRAATFRVHDPILFAHVRALLTDAGNEHRTPLGHFRAATALSSIHSTTQSVFEHIVRHHSNVLDHIAEFLPCSMQQERGYLRASMRGQLRESQAHCLDALARAGSRSFVLAPTGSGKTFVAVRRMSEMAQEVLYGFFFIDTFSGASAVACEIEERCDCDLIFLDPRKSHHPGAKEMRNGKLTGTYQNHSASPVPHSLNIVLYDHFAQYPDFRSSILQRASESFAIYDEVDRLYGESKRSLYAVPFARLFKHLLMMSATALRKHSEDVGPRAAIASLFAPVPVSKSSLLVFFAGSVQSFSHQLAYEKEHAVLRFTAYLTVDRSSTFHDLSERAFEASINKLLEAARMYPPCILACESVSQVNQILAQAPEECQTFPRSENETLSKPIVVISKYKGRSTNFGSACNSLVSLPLASSVATRRQLEGRLTRGPLRKLRYFTVIPQHSVLDFLYKQQTSSDNLQIKLENLVALANSIQERRQRE